jgi:hypothetical protein
MIDMHKPLSEAFQRGQRDGRLLAEDFPDRTEADLRAEAELQLRILASTGVCIQTPNDYIQGLFAGYKAA